MLQEGHGGRAGFVNTLGQDMVESIAQYKSTVNDVTAPSEATLKQTSPTKYSGLLSG